MIDESNMNSSASKHFPGPLTKRVLLRAAFAFALFVAIGLLVLSSRGEASLASLCSLAGAARLQSDLATSALPHESAAWPQKIWQTGSDGMVQTWKKQVRTWTDLNPGWQYTFLSDDAGVRYVDHHFSTQPTIHYLWHQLNSTILHADLLRYLIMLAEGGVYSDMDTSCLKSVEDWIPHGMNKEAISVVAGIEYDDNTYPMFARPISLCQWTLMAKPGHAVFKKVVARVVHHLEYLARIRHVELSELELAKKEVLDATGPGAFTDSIVEVISESEGRRVEWVELSGLREPKLYGDVLILPINAFAGNQKHSHSGDAAYGPKFVQHHFGRSWYQRPGSKQSPKKDDLAQAKHWQPG